MALCKLIALILIVAAIEARNPNFDVDDVPTAPIAVPTAPIADSTPAPSAPNLPEETTTPAPPVTPTQPPVTTTQPPPVTTTRVGIVGTPTPPPNIIREWPTAPITCPPTGIHYFGHHAICTVFQVCNFGRLHQLNCPLAQHWSTVRGACEFPDRANCPH